MELTRDSQIFWGAEEGVRQLFWLTLQTRDRCIRCTRSGRFDGKDLSCTLAVGRCDDWGMTLDEVVLGEVACYLRCDERTQS